MPRIKGIVLSQAGEGRHGPPRRNGARSSQTMIFSRKARERHPRKMRKTGVNTDALAAAIAIANGARRRQYRRETLRGIAPIVALAIGIVLCIATMATLAAAPATIPLWCTAFGDCPEPF
jgi:hypothetical protein